MFGALVRSCSRRWCRALLVMGCLGVLACAGWCFRDTFIHSAKADPAPGRGVTLVTGTESTDYSRRIVAYINGTTAITRQELGEYLIARHGYEKLPNLLNKRIVDDACKARGIEITIAEIDAALAQDLKGLQLDINGFVRTVLARYRKNLTEWKLDVLRPRLQMQRLVQDRISHTEDELRKAYEAQFGEKVEGRMIIWPLDQEREAIDSYGKLRDSEAAFAEKAKQQPRGELASTGGKIKPFGRYCMDPNLEREVFKLRPGQVTTLVKTPQGIVLFKCDKRIPADTTVNFESVKDKLVQQVREQKMSAEMGSYFQKLKDEARVQPVLKKLEKAEAGPMPSSSAVVAYIHGTQAVTREELGEYLITRYGADRLEFLVNWRIIENACKEKNVSVSEQEIEQAMDADLKMLNVDRKHFEKQLLSKFGKNLFEWREDVVKPKLLLTKLAQARVNCTQEDLTKAFEAYHGEKLSCRIILWPPDQGRFALTEYARIRDSEEEFHRKACSQASPSLAGKAGRIPPFGKHTLGNEDLEREAFKLSPGEVSPIVETPQGQVVMKCDKRIPADTSVKLEQVREQLKKDVLERKVQLEMQVVFKELQAKATPRMLLKGARAVENLAEKSQELMKSLPASAQDKAPRFK